MTGHNGDAVFYLLALILPLSALLARRMPIKQMALLIGAWIGIILIALLILNASRDTVGSAWSRLRAMLGDDEQRVTGDVVRLRMAPDGHFWATASINGVDTRMLIDSGATTTSLSVTTADAAGLNLQQSPFPVLLNTANGTVMARSANVAELRLGPITASDLRVVVAREFGTMNVLGMNFLSRLRSWRVEGNMLILEPKR